MVLYIQRVLHYQYINVHFFLYYVFLWFILFIFRLGTLGAATPLSATDYAKYPDLQMYPTMAAALVPVFNLNGAQGSGFDDGTCGGLLASPPGPSQLAQTQLPASFATIYLTSRIITQALTVFILL